MVRGFGIAFAVFFSISILGVGVLWMTTRDTSILSSAVLNRAQAAMAAAQQTALAPPDDPALGGDVLDAQPEATTTAPNGGELEVFRVQARDDLIKGFMITMLLGLTITFGWLGATYSKGRSVSGPLGARSMAPFWWGGLILCGVAGGVVAFYMLRFGGLLGMLAGGVINIGVLVSLLLLLIAYYLGTAFGISDVMKPSVPGATLFIR
jgi:hypothetical protein